MVDLFKQLIELIRNPGGLVAYGLATLALIIFLETGALVFFLPGDSLLVTAGLYASNAKVDLSLSLGPLGTLPGILALNVVLIPMAILGDATSYLIGAKTGPRIFSRPRSRLFRPEYLAEAQKFYEKHGGKAIIIARFMPLVRTFVPVVAGVAKMPYRRFATYNIVGGALWVLSMTLTGYLLGNLVPNIEKHIEKVIIVVVLLSISPGIWHFAQRRMEAKKAAGAPPA
jgi:membrane-associated protein